MYIISTRDGLGAGDAVGVEQKKNGAPLVRVPRFTPVAKPSLVGALDQLHPRKAGADLRGGLHVGFVIDDHNLTETLAARLERREAACQLVIAPVVDDHDVHRGKRHQFAASR